jgi:ankyrin repeat protein
MGRKGKKNHTKTTKPLEGKHDHPLFKAVCDDDYKRVMVLLSLKANPNIGFGVGYTALVGAAHKGYTGVAKLLLVHKADVHAVTTKHGVGPIHAAVHNGHMELLSLLLEHRADVNMPDKLGATPLHTAAMNNDVKVASVLLKHQAVVDVHDETGSTALCVAARHDQCDVLSILLEHRANPLMRGSGGDSPLLCAMNYEHSDVVKRMLPYLHLPPPRVDPCRPGVRNALASHVRADLCAFAATHTELKQCLLCHLPSTIDGKRHRKCGRCKAVYYCSKECHVQHWPIHKASCIAKAVPEEVD